MASAGVNVFRWTALFAGLSYGLYHQNTLNTQSRANEQQRRYAHEESVIAKAKAEYLRKSLPADKLTPGGGVISDPDDPKFDLEAYLTMKESGEQ